METPMVSKGQVIFRKRKPVCKEIPYITLEPPPGGRGRSFKKPAATEHGGKQTAQLCEKTRKEVHDGGRGEGWLPNDEGTRRGAEITFLGRYAMDRAS